MRICLEQIVYVLVKANFEREGEFEFAMFNSTKPRSGLVLH